MSKIANVLQRINVFPIYTIDTKVSAYLYEKLFSFQQIVGPQQRYVAHAHIFKHVFFSFVFSSRTFLKCNAHLILWTYMSFHRKKNTV